MTDKRVVQSSDQAWVEASHGDFFAVKCRRLGHAAGSVALGCNEFELAPGKTAMPFHAHLANEEALYVLAGTGTLRLGDERHAVRAGDYAAFPAGPDTPHQLTNTGAEPLRYLVVSTQLPTDVVLYPDSKKVGAMSADGFKRFFVDGTAVGYWEGEPTGTGSESKSKSKSGSKSASKAKPEPDKAEAAGDEDDVDLEARIDEEIADLKAKLGLSGGDARARKQARPKKGTKARKVVDDALDELERLKRLLDG